jgi:hypothetical protein
MKKMKGRERCYKDRALSRSALVGGSLAGLEKLELFADCCDLLMIANNAYNWWWWLVVTK